MEKSPFAKLEALRADERHTIISLENFQLNLVFQLSERTRFQSLLSDGADALTWNADRTAHRGCADATVCASLDLMLGVIASYIPIISRAFITEEATDLNQIWSRVRTFYGCQRSGARILDILDFRQKENESHEALWERMHAYIRDSLIRSAEVKHDGFKGKESMTPTIQNILTCVWLKAIDPGLPGIVKLKFGTELQSKSLYSIRETISSAIPTLRSELGGALIERVRLRGPQQQPPRRRTQKQCCLCEAAGRSGAGTHFLSDCQYLPEEDRQYMKGAAKARTRMMEGGEEQEDLQNQTDTSMTQKVSLQPSPILQMIVNQRSTRVTLDSGAESNLISHQELQRLGLTCVQTSQRASQADGSTPLRVLGECKFSAKCGHHELFMDCLVVDNLGCPILAGVPFHSKNHVYVKMAEKVVHINDCCEIHYDQHSNSQDQTPSQCRLTHILRAPSRTTILPGENITLEIPADFRSDETVVVEPRYSDKGGPFNPETWLLPKILKINEGTVEIINPSLHPIQLNRHEQFANIRRTVEPDAPISTSTSSHPDPSGVMTKPPASVNDGLYFSDKVSIDPARRLPEYLRASFQRVNRKFDDVFNPKIGMYNGSSGPFQCVVNVGPALPPQRKGRIPMYKHSDKITLQSKIDELCDQNVLATPESLGITAEYLNPAFLVRKSNNDFRLVTAFGEIAQYSKPQQSLLPNVDETLRAIGQWRYLVKSDLKSAYYQIPLSKDSLKFCGISSPFKGTRVYTRCAMGMPGSETALEQLMTRILGDLTKTGQVAKIADDLYCGSNTPEGLLLIWEQVLALLHKNGLRLSTSKTVCCPASTEVLGWIWSDGVLTASKHRISALQTCQAPKTVFGLRSFMGAFKFLGRVVPSYCDVLDPLESYAAGKDTKHVIEWTETLLQAFTAAQTHLSKATSITLPRHEDKLCIITDASKVGMAATLFIFRNGHRRLAGFFNAKMKAHHRNWLPCEIEALCIGSAVKYFAPYIVQSAHQTVILTDSRPCVQAYAKLCRGEFSSSARVLTFLSILTTHGVRLDHIRGCENLASDFMSRTPIECLNASCQVCKFVEELEESAVFTVTGDAMPSESITLYTNRNSWHQIQRSCQDLARVHAHLAQGTRPGKNAKNVKDIRKYLGREIRIADDGLLVKTKEASTARPATETIVVPRTVAHGVVSAIHLKLGHPAKLQLRRTLERLFFILNMDRVIERVTDNCDLCKSIATVPTKFTAQTTGPLPRTIGQTYSADVIRRSGQCIMVCRENTTAFTSATLIPDETAESLADGLTLILSSLRSVQGPPVTVRVDPAPGFRSLFLNQRSPLETEGIKLELGAEKNVNKNPIAERAIREVHAHLVRLQPHGGRIAPSTLARAISNINSQIRDCGLSSHELWTCRNQYDGSQLPLVDSNIINARQQQRERGHLPSAKYRARGRTESRKPAVHMGQLVYLHTDRDKTKIRDRYLVVGLSDTECEIQKFTGAQLRARRYKVKLDICEPIQCSIPELAIPDSDSDSDLDVPRTIINGEERDSENGNSDNDNEIVLPINRELDDNVALNQPHDDDDNIRVPVMPPVPQIPNRGNLRNRNLVKPTAWDDDYVEFTSSDSDEN